ncbi:MAG: hypothetical protein RL037_175 [Bacteroidota bacterium]|jgi:O-antigen ligase
MSAVPFNLTHSPEKDWRFYILLLNGIFISTLELAPFALLLMTLICIYYVVKQKDKTELPEWSNWKKALLVTIPFILACMGMVNTSNIPKALEDISRLLPFLQFPFLFLSIPYQKRVKWQEPFIWSIIIGVLLKTDFYLLKAIYRFVETANIRHFYYINLAKETNSLSFFILVSFLFFSLKFRQNNQRKQKWILGVLIILNLIVVLLLLQSRIIIIVFLLTTLILFFLNLKNKSSILLAGSFVISLFFLGVSPSFNARFQRIEPINNQKAEIVSASEKSSDKLNKCNSTELRINASKASLEVIKTKLIFGVGTGDWNDELVLKYKELNMSCNFVERTAPHNQFLRITLKHGIIGLLIFIGFLFLFFLHSWRIREMYAISFSIACSLCLVAYDFVDIGSSAPFLALIFSWFIIKKE